MKQLEAHKTVPSPKSQVSASLSPNISKVIVACYKGDFWLAEICLSSIRYWYPNVAISLVYDQAKGPADFRRVREKFGADIMELPIRKFGWGLSKIEVLFHKTNERVLVIDADIIFLGPVLDYLADFTEDFVVSADYHSMPEAPWMNHYYFDYKKLKAFDPDFEFPGYSFNTGQFVATLGKLKREDFDQVVLWKEFPEVIQDNIFACADQGVLNYVLPMQEAAGKISIGKASFLMPIGFPESKTVSLERIKSKEENRPLLLHWAGCNTNSLYLMPRRELLRFFRDRDTNNLGTISNELQEILRFANYKVRRFRQQLYRKINQLLKRSP